MCLTMLHSVLHVVIPDAQNFCLVAFCKDCRTKLCNGSSGRPCQKKKTADSSHYQSSNIYALEKCSQEALMTDHWLLQMSMIWNSNGTSMKNCTRDA